MAIPRSKEFEELLENIQQCLKKYSVQELNQALVTFFAKKQDNADEIDFVLQTVANEYSISKRTLIHSSARGNVQEAKEQAYCILHLNLGITLRHISKRIFLQRNHQGVSKVIQEFKNKSTEVKWGKSFIPRNEKIQKQLAEYLTSNKD